MRQGRELNIAWRVNSNVLISITANERQELYKAVCKKDILERIVQLLHLYISKHCRRSYKKQRCETSNGENWPDSNLLILSNQVDGLGHAASSHVGAALNDPL